MKLKIKYWGWKNARLWLKAFPAGSDHPAYSSLVIGPVEVIIW